MGFFSDVFTSSDNATFSLSKLIGSVGGVAMVFNFIKAGSVDFQGFAIGMSTLIAALAVKKYVETK